MGPCLFQQQQVAAHTHTHTQAVHRTTSALPSCSAAWFMRVMRWRCCWMRQLLNGAVFLPSGGAGVHVLNFYAVVVEMLKGNLIWNNLPHQAAKSLKQQSAHASAFPPGEGQKPAAVTQRKQKKNTKVELTHGGSPEDGGGARPRLGGALDRWGYSPLWPSERHSWPEDRKKGKGSHQWAGKRMEVTREM